MAPHQGEERRGSRLRRIQEERRSDDDRRRARRRLLPMGAGRVDGELLTLSPGQGRIQHLVLWDLTREGACLAVNGELEVGEGAPCRLTFYEYLGLDSIWLQARIVWIEPTEADTFVGVAFDQALPAGTFLDTYLARHWTD